MALGATARRVFAPILRDCLNVLFFGLSVGFLLAGAVEAFSVTLGVEGASLNSQQKRISCVEYFRSLPHWSWIGLPFQQNRGRARHNQNFQWIARACFRLRWAHRYELGRLGVKFDTHR